MASVYSQLVCVLLFFYLCNDSRLRSAFDLLPSSSGFTVSWNPELVIHKSMLEIDGIKFELSQVMVPNLVGLVLRCRSNVLQAKLA